MRDHLEHVAVSQDTGHRTQNADQAMGFELRSRSWRALYDNVKYLTLLASTTRNKQKRNEMNGKAKNVRHRMSQKNHNKNVSQIVKM